MKDIDPLEQRVKGYCPLTPNEVGIFLTALGYPSRTPIFIAAGDIYGGDSRMVDLESRFPILMSKASWFSFALVDTLEVSFCHIVYKVNEILHNVAEGFSRFCFMMSNIYRFNILGYISQRHC